MANEIKSIDETIDVECVNECLVPHSNIRALIDRSAFIINTLDEPYIGYTSSKISRLCMEEKKVHYIAGGFDAHLASTGELIIPYVTPCVECYATHFKHALENWKPKKHPVEKRYTEIGGLASMTLFSSSFACIELFNFTPPLNAKTPTNLVFSRVAGAFLKT